MDEDNFPFLRQQLRGIVNHGFHYGFWYHRETLHKDDVISKLKELGELKDKGIITEDEFTKMKEKLLG